MAEYEEQKKEKPSIDDMMDQLLTGEQKKAAEGFVKFLRDSKLNPQWGAKNSYNLGYKSRRVCIIKFSENFFELRLNTQYNDEFNECFSEECDETKQFLLSNVTYCFGCGTCKPGITMELLGTAVKGACFNPVLRIENPSEEKLMLAKKLVLLRKRMIAEGKAPKVTYISVKKR